MGDWKMNTFLPSKNFQSKRDEKRVCVYGHAKFKNGSKAHKNDD